MAEAGEVINQAFLSVFSNSSPTLHQKILHFAFGLVRREIPSRLFSGSTEGMDRAISFMDDPDIREFTLAVSFQFFARFGNSSQRYAELVDNLAQGIGFDKEHEAAALPKEILDRMPSFQDVVDTLTPNRWMVVMALMMLYLITPQDMAELYEAWKKKGVQEGWYTPQVEGKPEKK
jgi:hypothetical protein